jgi:hypothetical protein
MDLPFKNLKINNDISNLLEKTWVDKLLEKYSDCPNPINYPRSAAYYLKIRNMHKNERR